MANQTHNPIQSVKDATVAGAVARTVPCPSKYEWTINDVSSADAGRTEDGKMHKLRIGRKRKLILEWQNVKTADVNAVLVAFTPEYVDVNCLDPLTNGYATRTFYSGDQKAPAYSTVLGLWTVSFDIIEQ